MKKLFIFKKSSNSDYERELQYAFKKCSRGSRKDRLEDISADYLARNSIEVVVSNGLPKEWYLILKGLNIVTITIGELDRYFDLADIVIDYKSKNNNRYFTGPDYSILRNPGMEFEEITDLITKMDWDSRFWGYPVAYLSSRYLTENIMHRIEKIIKRERFHLIEYLCNCHDSRSVKIAERNGFHFTDIRLSFEKKLQNCPDFSLPQGIAFSKAKKEDIPVLKKISSDLYQDSRYFFDENFDRRKVRAFYQLWIERAVLGRYDDACFCLYAKGVPIGFCSIKYNLPSKSASIGLFGLAAKFQGKGLGKALLNMVFSELAGKNILKLDVVTQGRNYAAQRLYQKTGFLTKATELWYHKWL